MSSGEYALKHLPDLVKYVSYDYTVRAVTAMRGTSDQESVFSFTSKLQIGVNSPCNFVLQVR